MLVFAQRGHHAVFPGNTLQAFNAAVRPGVDSIQTDVRVTGDGVAVLFDDEHVRGRPVADLSRHDSSRIVGHAARAWLRTLAWDPRILARTLLRQAQAAHWSNFASGVVDADSMRLLARHGIDALITDHRADLVPAKLRGAPAVAPRDALSGAATAAGDAATGGPAAGQVSTGVGRTAKPEPRMDAAILLRASIELWSKEAGW